MASSALSMGVNFPDVRYIVHWGPARNLLDYHQESGRAGRDNRQADVITIYYGQQLTFCEPAVKDFVNATGRYRVSAYKPFDEHIQPNKPARDCCNNCAKMCKSLGSGCLVTPPMFEIDQGVAPLVQSTACTRPISEADKEDLREALNEVVNLILPTLNLLNQNAPLDYGKQMVADLVERCHCIFTVMDITEHLPVFSVYHALKIVEVFHEIFGDIPSLGAVVDLFGRGEQDLTKLPHFKLLLFDSDVSVEVKDDTF